MKNYIFSSSLLIMCIVLISCELQEETADLYNIDVKERISEYNRKLSKTNTSKHEAIQFDASIHTTIDERDHQIFIEMLTIGKDNFRKFKFQYDKELGLVDVPKQIDQGRIIYFGGNLLINDLKKNKYFYFLVEGFPQEIQELKSTISGNGLVSTKFSSESELLLRSGSNCSCECTYCGIQCSGPWCGTASASCTCGDNGQSVDCRNCYNANCTPCSDQ